MTTLRIGIIGTGAIAREHALAYGACQGVELAACMDLRQERAVAFASEHGVGAVCGSLDELLAHGGLDAVSVCTTNCAHAPATVAALEAGLHVLCEKPMAMNSVEAEVMVETARRTGRLLTVGHHFRFQPYVRRARELVREGAIGDLVYVRSHSLRRNGIPGWGDFRSGALSGGGALIDIGVHTLDMVLWVAGSPRPETVTGMTAAAFGAREDFVPAWGGYDKARFDVEDFAAGFVRLSSGACIGLEAAWAAGIPMEESYAQLFLGTRGGLLVNPFLPELPPIQVVEVGGGADRVRELQDFPEVSTYREEIRHWVACLRGEAENLVPAEEALAVQQILDGVYLSSELRREVRVAEIGQLLRERVASAPQMTKA